MKGIALQLQYEDWAYKHGYTNESQISLVADFLNGVDASTRKIESSLVALPRGIHLSKPVREAFFHAGQEFANLNHGIKESDLTTALSNLFDNLCGDMKKIVSADSILASTGDCRGACAYNTGDRSEYRNYGW